MAWTFFIERCQFLHSKRWIFKSIHLRMVRMLILGNMWVCKTIDWFEWCHHHMQSTRFAFWTTECRNISVFSNFVENIFSHLMRIHKNETCHSFGVFFGFCRILITFQYCVFLCEWHFHQAIPYMCRSRVNMHIVSNHTYFQFQLNTTENMTMIYNTTASPNLRIEIIL